MQDKNGSGEDTSGQTGQFQARGEPDRLRVEAGEGKKVRVEVDGKVMRGKLAVVTIVDDAGPQLRPGHVGGRRVDVRDRPTRPQCEPRASRSRLPWLFRRRVDQRPRHPRRHPRGLTRTAQETR